ncbi:MAG: tripartite tricarboxylate transporter substrate binding protein, partial [Pseudomonadota bacterium]
MNAFNAVVRMVTVGVLMAIAGSVGAQQAYPSKPIRIISPYSPGGGNDIMSRLLGQKLTEAWGQQVVVENRPGGNTIIGTEATAKAPPDGYTILLAPSSHVVVPLLMKTPYDPFKDFTPITSLARGEHLMVISPAVPAKDLQEFIALAKSKQIKLNYATYGAGSTSHIIAEFFNLTTGLKMQHVPYKGTGPALTDVMGGQVEVFMSTMPPAVPLVKSGKLKAIAITGEKRSAALPQVPTFLEYGLSEFRKIGSFYGIIGPAHIPKAIVDKLAAQIAKIQAMPDFKEKLATQGVVPLINTPEQFM